MRVVRLPARQSGVELARRRHWVFDMDGTLTVAVHDFAAIRRALEIPAEADIGVADHGQFQRFSHGHAPAS